MPKKTLFICRIWKWNNIFKENVECNQPFYIYGIDLFIDSINATDSLSIANSYYFIEYDEYVIELKCIMHLIYIWQSYLILFEETSYVSLFQDFWKTIFCFSWHQHSSTMIV